KGVSLLFEKRSKKLNNQPGEICFPGGKLEQGETMKECVVRETMEELLIHKSQIELLGPGDIFVSPFNIMIHPFIGILKDYEDSFSKDEVDSIIKVPLEFFRSNDPEKFKNRI